ncbi:MAG: hypothetical protein KAW86_08515 [Bacteroidales bacterium]|nr:hypothetical protein [Bacteroidales bacterium]
MKKFTLLIFVMLISSAVVFAQATQKKITKSEQGYSQVLTKTTPKIVNNNNSNSRATAYTIDFEDEVEWTFDFDPWTVNDVDGLPTYGFTDYDFPHEFEPMAYIVFDPDLTTPPMTDDYGLERFNIGISNANDNIRNDQSITYYVENLEGTVSGCEYTVTIRIRIGDELRCYWASQTKTIAVGETETFTFVYDEEESILEETAIITYSGGSEMFVSDIRNSYIFEDACLNYYNSRYDTMWDYLNGNNFQVFQDFWLGKNR